MTELAVYPHETISLILMIFGVGFLSLRSAIVRPQPGTRVEFSLGNTQQGHHSPEERVAMAFGRKRKDKQSDVEIIATDNGGEPSATDTTQTEDATPEATLSPEDTAEALAGAAEAARDAEEEKQAQARERDAKRNAELEARYSHVVPGSIRHVPKGEKVGDTTSKGKVATIKCVEPDCDATREVNCQDLFQTRRCVACTKTHLQNKQKTRRAERAAARKAKEADATDNGTAA